MVSGERPILPWARLRSMESFSSARGHAAALKYASTSSAWPSAFTLLKM
jgi:hypothetical protein